MIIKRLLSFSIKNIIGLWYTGVWKVIGITDTNAGLVGKSIHMNAAVCKIIATDPSEESTTQHIPPPFVENELMTFLMKLL